MALITKTTLADMNIGDVIPCRYTAGASGAIGTFSELGTCVAAEIPVTGSATPDGLFNFVKVGKGLCIADRVVQHSISWDALNTDGLIEGNTEKFLNGEIIIPETLPVNAGNSVTFSPDGIYMAVAIPISPFVTIYKRNEDVFTKLPNPDVLPTGRGNGVAFSADGTYIAIAHNIAPFITIYKHDGDVFTKLPDPDVLPTGEGHGVAFSPDGIYMSVATHATPFILIYKRSGDTFTKLANPTTLPAGVGYGVAFSPDGTYMSVAHYATPYLTIYKRSGDTFTKLTNPTTLPANTGYSVTFSPDGTYMSVAHFVPPNITIYKRSGDTFTKLSDPDILPGGTGNDVAFSPDGTYLTIAHQASPNITIYKRSGNTFSKLANPETLPTGTGQGLAFSPDGTYMTVTNSGTPNLIIYKTPYYMIRSLSGGCAYADANGNLSITNREFGAWPINNEWDKYIRNSDLDGKITKGDNNVWNHATIESYVQETPILAIGANTNRVKRRSIYFAQIVSTTANTTLGFRPVLEYIEPNGSSKQTNLFY